eukprot:maker-scaffold1404_size42976-snap-gene-0.12 protein:Tk06751 transcript:maker-scaffold1404_size42976-snap-gene-0.12-mRNA-1 annotation:"---NA---"
MESVRQMLNRPEVRNLNCIRDVKFPVNYSLHAVELRPTEGDPGLVSLTIRIPGEIRVVHGSEEIYGAIKAAVKKMTSSTEEPEGLQILEKQGAWVLKLEHGLFAKKQGVEMLCQVLENISSAGFEVVTSSRFSTTPGFELRTWILKKAATPIENPMVIALALPAPDKICVVGAQEDTPANNVVMEAIAKIMPPSATEVLEEKAEEVEAKTVTSELKEGDEEKPAENPEDGEKKDEADNKEVKSEVEPKKEEKPTPDKVEEGEVKKEEVDEEKPEKEANDEKVKEFILDMNQLNADNGKILRSKLLLEILHQLFCRQWKLVCCSRIPFGGDHEVLFFVYDARILPGLGQDHFSMLELEKPDLVRLYGMNEDLEGKVKTIMQEHWMPGLDSKDPEVVHEVKTFKLLETPWNQSCVVKEGSGPMPRLAVSPQILVAKFLLALNKAEMNVYESVTLDAGKVDQKTLIIFKQSNVGFTQELTLKLAGVNRIGVIGGSEADIEAIRKCLQSRWPYPLTHDYKVEKDGNEEEFWQFKELSDLGWRVQFCGDISSQTMAQKRPALPERPSDPVSLFFLK